MRRSVPIMDVLAAAGGSTLSGTWGKDLTLLHQHHVHSAGCWKDLSADGKKKLVDAGLAPEVVSALDRAVAGESTAASTGLAKDAKKIVILFGSQTGTAEAYAKMLATFAVSHGMLPIVCSLNDGVQVLKNGVQAQAIIYVCSTYGMGEFPSNAGKEAAAGRRPDAEHQEHAVRAAWSREQPERELQRGGQAVGREVP
jgi:sulfite reductase alpha subunit-like flavoprotein